MSNKRQKKGILIIFAHICCHENFVCSIYFRNGSIYYHGSLHSIYILRFKECTRYEMQGISRLSIQPLSLFVVHIQNMALSNLHGDTTSYNQKCTKELFFFCMRNDLTIHNIDSIETLKSQLGIAKDNFHFPLVNYSKRKNTLRIEYRNE